MLALTKQAAAAVDQIVNQPDLPPGAVLRISAPPAAEDGDGPARELQLVLVEQPDEEDVVVDEVGISVDPEALEYLDDKVLDAEFERGEVQFSLFRQPGAASMNGDTPLA